MVVEDPQALILAGVAVLAIIYVVRWQTDPFRSIPTVGGSSAPGLSIMAAYNWKHNSRKLISEGCQKYHDSAFKVALFDRWLVLVSGSKLMEQLVRRPDNELSAIEGAVDLFQLRYIAAAESFDDPYHSDIIREKLTRTLPVIFPDVLDEVKLALSDYLPTKDDEWAAVNVMTTMQELVVRASGRVFVGLPLCRNKEYLGLALRFTTDVVQNRSHLAPLPHFLKPLLGHFLNRPKKTIRQAMKFIQPLINERRANMRELGEDWSDKPNDMLQWIIEEAILRKTTDHNIVERVFLVNFAAIHSSTTTITQALYDIASMPERIPELREEIETIIATDGWTKTAMGKMWKLDSVFKETLRCHGLGLAGLIRKAMKDVTLSDGTFIPKGTLLAAAVDPMHHDESVYANPEVLDPFRFAKLREGEGEGLRHQVVNTSVNYLPFGHGKHACPGRFFAANELKTMLAFIVLNYDLKLGGDGKRPADALRGTTFLLPSGPVFFRKRQAVAES
ncbi:cytochrome P450 [Ganoderma leucocontextum]|nr:cytochrome P450 [Ganoderma leucocontextum]